MSEYNRQGSRVYGNGTSYNCTNIATAKQLQTTLNTYQHDLQLAQNTNTKLDKIEQQIIILQMDLSNIQNTLNTIKETLKQ